MACIHCQSCDRLIDLDYDVDHEEFCAEDQEAMWERSGIPKPITATEVNEATTAAIEESKKSPAMTAFLEETLGRSTAIATATCSICKCKAVVFKDEVSRREYGISGMCQPCQDKMWG
jgi:hypothetical protein